jgi:hypothetical protein
MIIDGGFVADEPQSFLLTTAAGSRIFCGPGPARRRPGRLGDQRREPGLRGDLDVTVTAKLAERLSTRSVRLARMILIQASRNAMVNDLVARNAVPSGEPGRPSASLNRA